MSKSLSGYYGPPPFLWFQNQKWRLQTENTERYSPINYACIFVVRSRITYEPVLLTFLIPNCSAKVFSGPRNPAAIMTRSALKTFSELGISSIVHRPEASCNLRISFELSYLAHFL